MLAAASGAQLRELKLGYRDDYIIRASEAVASKTIDLPGLISCDFGEAVRTLKTLRGVGDKVANCIALYGLHHIEAFPVDVWIARVIKEIYNNQFNAGLYPGFAGIVQQYMFYYMRHLKGVSA
jgi:N-glycosylase/DNA lyase